MAQKRIDFFGGFQPTGADPTAGAKYQALAGIGQTLQQGLTGIIQQQDAKQQQQCRIRWRRAATQARRESGQRDEACAGRRARQEKAKSAAAPGLHGRDQRELRGAVETACLDPLEHLGGLDGDATGDLDRHLRRPLVGEVADAGTTGQHALPGGRDVATERAGGAHPGDQDSGATHQAISPGRAR